MGDTKMTATELAKQAGMNYADYLSENGPQFAKVKTERHPLADQINRENRAHWDSAE